MASLLTIYGNRGSEPNLEKEGFMISRECIEAVLTIKGIKKICSFAREHCNCHPSPSNSQHEKCHTTTTHS